MVSIRKKTTSKKSVSRNNTTKKKTTKKIKKSTIRDTKKWKQLADNCFEEK